LLHDNHHSGSGAQRGYRGAKGGVGAGAREQRRKALVRQREERRRCTGERVA